MHVQEDYNSLFVLFFKALPYIPSSSGSYNDVDKKKLPNLDLNPDHEKCRKSVRVVNHVQWNLRIMDKLEHGPLSTINLEVVLYWGVFILLRILIQVSTSLRTH